MAIYSGFSHWKWWFSIAMLVHQRVWMFFPCCWSNQQTKINQALQVFRNIDPPVEGQEVGTSEVGNGDICGHWWDRKTKKHAQIKDIFNDMDFQAGNSRYCFQVFGSRLRPCAGRRLCGLPVGDKRVKPRLQVGCWDQVRVLSDFPARLCECHLCSWEVRECRSLSEWWPVWKHPLYFIRNCHSRMVST